jgi:hypothetical protein
LSINVLAALPSAAQEHRPDFLRLLTRPPQASLLLVSSAEEHEATDVPNALRWRLATMLDEHGRIPPGARYAANVHRRNALAHKPPSHLSTLGSLGPGSALGSISPTSWTSRGPQNVGGRTRSLLIDPLNTNVLFAGAVGGGIWKSSDGGTTWTPLNDFMQNLSVSSMVMDPFDHNIMYAATGEALYGDGLPGAGIFKTTTGGTTWTLLTATQNWQYIYRLAISSSGVLLASVGDGIYRSTDGGTNWTHVYTPLLNGWNVVAFDPNNANNAVGVGVGVDQTGYYTQLLYSANGGLTWNNSTMPVKPYNGAITEAAWGPSSNVYVNLGIQSGSTSGEVWRSQNGGASYTRVSQQGVTDCTYNHCAIWVSPNNANLVVIGGLLNYRSTDGGATWTQINYVQSMTDEPHADTHWFVNDPVNVNKFYVCNDGGVYRNNDITTAAPGNGSWTSRNATYQTTQFYAGAGSATGFWPLTGGTQDNGTLRVSVYDQFSPSSRPATTANMWSIGGDGGYVAIDSTNPNYWYGEYQWMEIFRSTNGGETFGASDITSGLTFGQNAHEAFIAPVIMDPNNPNVLLAGGGSLWRTTTASYSTPVWSAIRGESTPWSNISAVAIAKGNSDIIWVGEFDGHLQKTTNGTSSNPSFTDIDNNTAGTNPLPDRSILRIMVDPADPNLVYVALGGYSVNSPAPANLWRSTNGGATWTPAAGSGLALLPYVPIRSIVRHPRNQQVLYAATDIGIYESDDGGASWSTSQQGPADVSVDELAFVAGSELLLAATHGRGLWTADTSSVPTLAPTAVNAVASGTSSVAVTWTGVSSATSYQVMRSSDGQPYANATNGLVSGTSYTDSSVVAGKTYLYKVKAFVNGLWTDLSAPDLATTIVFTDDNALYGKVILATHLQEINTAVNAVMTAAGQTPTFGSVTSGTPVRTTDITLLRSALVSAYAKIGMPTVPTFAEAITSSTLIKGSHYQEVRDKVK